MFNQRHQTILSKLEQQLECVNPGVFAGKGASKAVTLITGNIQEQKAKLMLEIRSLKSIETQVGATEKALGQKVEALARQESELCRQEELQCSTP